MRAKHTPGPWSVDGTWPELVAIYDSRAIYLAHAETGYGKDWIAENPLGTDVAQANAKLIAASPELLEACERALGHYNQEHGNCAGCNTCNAVKGPLVKAIAKAYGKQP
jgi:hypothetical protein